MTHALRRDGWTINAKRVLRVMREESLLCQRKRRFVVTTDARQPAPGLIHHSDHGVQYASTRYVERLQHLGAQVSMAAVGNPYQNALAESFFATLKREEVYLHEYRTYAEAETNLERFIDEVSNHKRLHSSLGYRPPSEFEAGFGHERDDERFLEGTGNLTLALVRS